MRQNDPRLLEPAHYPFSVELATRFADLDINRHLNNVALMAILEDARVRFLYAEPVAEGLRGRQVFLVAAQIEFVAQTRYPDPVQVHIAVTDIGRSSWTISELLTQRGAPCVWMSATLVTSDGQRALPLEAGLRDYLASAPLGARRDEAGN